MVESTDLLKLGRVCGAVTLAKPTIYRLIKSGDFPKPVKLSPRRVAWRAEDVNAWIASRCGSSTVNGIAA